MERLPSARRLVGCLAVLIVCALSACSSTRSPNIGRIPGLTVGLPPSTEPYRIQAGDELEVRFFHTPEQNVTLRVRPDGYISLPLVYELYVANRTVEEVRLELTERVARELAAPEVAVIVRNFSTYQVHVGGEVQRPGALDLTGPRTVLQAVMEAGGFLPTASAQDVMVVRVHSDGGYEIVEADLEDVLLGEDVSGNFVLRPWDVVFVPTTPIADVNKWVDQYVRKNVPISLTYRIDSPDD
jgi:polysaccharide export outer membrane protein